MAKVTKQKIILESLRLFQEKGYNNVSVEDICGRLGITRGTFYYHFKTKTAILNSVYIDQRLDRSIEEISAMFSDNRWEQLWWLVEDSLNYNEELGCDVVSWLLASYLTEKTLIFRATKRSYEIYSKVIESGQRSGQFRNRTDPGTLATLLFSLIHGINFEWCNQSGAFSLKDRVRHDLILLLDVKDSCLV